MTRATAAKREKVFGPGRAIPFTREQKVRLMAYAKAWSSLHREGRQHTGPITRAAMDVLRALLWDFHNEHTGRCFPGQDRIAAKAGCHRDTVVEALKVLERAGIVGWDHRLVRVAWRIGGELRQAVHRTSNSYWFNDRSPATLPKRAVSENPPRTQSKSLSIPCQPLETEWESAARQLRAMGMAVPAAWGV